MILMPLYENTLKVPKNIYSDNTLETAVSKIANSLKKEDYISLEHYWKIASQELTKEYEVQDDEKAKAKDLLKMEYVKHIAKFFCANLSTTYSGTLLQDFGSSDDFRKKITALCIKEYGLSIEPKYKHELDNVIGTYTDEVWVTEFDKAALAKQNQQYTTPKKGTLKKIEYYQSA